MAAAVVASGCAGASTSGGSSESSSTKGAGPTTSSGSGTPAITTGSSGGGGAGGAAGTSSTTGTTSPPVLVVGTATAIATSTSTSVATQPTQQGGQLTAGVWDDNLNFSFYSSYLSTTAATQLSGMPVIERSDRMVILVKSADGQPVAGAQVSVSDSAGHEWASLTGAEGRVLYFPGWASVVTGTPLTITATVAGASVSQAAVATAGTVELTLAESGLPMVGGLDLAFVIDTTGSMGDELSYVQSELDHIVNGIAAQFPGIAQRWALVVYRDTGDEYVVRSFDFTSDLTSFRQHLAAQSANGGNDYPEAVDQALAAATQLSWKAGATARVAFWIADAPHHVGREAALVSALAAATAKGVHVYPVAASGIDDLGEFSMRTTAEVTGGRYLFLTNDSGIGGDHAEPHIPCYYVTTLESAMRRMVATELTGSYVAPTTSEIIRTGGNPESQQCTLTGGALVTAW